ncbi:MAG: CBS domain-containing protein [Polyangiaceae bacterium]
MSRVPFIKHLMTPFPFTIEATASLEDAEAMFDKHDISHLPVAHGGKLSGVITKHDVLRALAHGSEESVSVADVAVSDPYVVDLHTRADEVLHEMALRHIGSVLVTREDKLAGIYTANDAMRDFAEHLAALEPPNTVA